MRDALRQRMEKAEGLLNEIVERVQQGLPIIYPTSTLPALGCLPQTDALDSLFELKKRSETKIVSLGVCNLEQAAEIVDVPDIASEILDSFPVGSLTLILPALETLDARLGGNAVAVRVLADARARELISLTGPLTATSGVERSVWPLRNQARSSNGKAKRTGQGRAPRAWNINL